jgi:hypothetical protein
MKTDLMPSIVKIEAEVLKNLVKEVKETVANGINIPETSERKFGAVDMWNIRKNAKSAVSRFR